MDVCTNMLAWQDHLTKFHSGVTRPVLWRSTEFLYCETCLRQQSLFPVGMEVGTGHEATAVATCNV